MKPMKKLLSVILLILVAAACFVSCQSSNDKSYESGSAKGDYYMNGSSAGSPSKEDQVVDDGSLILTENRKIIKTVNQSLQTEDFDATIDNINSLVTELGGYITNSSFSGESYYDKDTLRSASLTVRIPAEKLSDFVGRVENGAVVTRYNESADDVSGAYIDVESKIAVYEAEEIALLEMLENSASVTTMLEIRTRLNEVQYSLASLRAQKNSYDSLIAYSTVFLSVNEVRQAVKRDPGFFEEIGANFSDSIYNIGSFFRNFAVWFIGDFLYIVLWAAVIAAALFVFVKLRKKRKSKNNSQKEKGSSDEDTAEEQK